MPISITKSGPYFSSGSISFSQLRTNFAERSSGTISASQLRRNENIKEKNPIVPDSTENEQISTDLDLSLLQFRNSVKRYIATQSDIDDNSSDELDINGNSIYEGEPGFRMGSLDLNNRGIDWSGGGYSGRDGQGGGTTGNLTKNVQKSILINGTCGSVRPNMPAAELQPNPNITAHNVTIHISGSILGYGGLGSTSENGDAQKGGTALNLGNIGNNIIINISSQAKIYGGGGGGEKGGRGADGANGTCFNYSFYYVGSGCEWYGKCYPGDDRVGGGEGVEGCACFIWCRKTRISAVLCRRKNPFTKAGGAGGIGGNGGNGRGYNNQVDPILGSGGSLGQSSDCGGSNGTITTPGTGITGKTGGSGGDWGKDGDATIFSGNPGKAGNAITKTGLNYNISGVKNGDTIKGYIS